MTRKNLIRGDTVTHNSYGAGVVVDTYISVVLGIAMAVVDFDNARERPVPESKLTKTGHIQLDTL